MNRISITMSRQQLYDLVWSKPMRDAAATIPISNVELKNVCLRWSIPVPPQGYWSKLRAGHRVRKIQLPPNREGQSEEVVIFARAPLHGAVLEARTRALAAAAQLPLRVEPATNHEYVADLKRALVGTVPDKSGALTLRGGGEAKFSVSSRNADRALSLLNRFCHAAEALGYSISFGARQPTELVIEGERLPFFLTEHYTRVERRVADAEKQAPGPANRHYYDPIGGRHWIYTATGKLQINFGGIHGRGLRQEWSDQPGALLESQIAKVLGEAAAMAADMHEQRQQRARRMAEQREAELRRQEELRFEKLEDQREEFLSEKAQMYEEAMQLTAFLSYINCAAPSSRSPKLTAFLVWASDHVRDLQAACTVEAIAEDLESSELFA